MCLSSQAYLLENVHSWVYGDKSVGSNFRGSLRTHKHIELVYYKNPLLVPDKYMDTFLQVMGCSHLCPYVHISCQATVRTSYKMFRAT